MVAERTEVGDHRAEREVVAVLAELVEHDAQEPRVAGRRAAASASRCSASRPFA